MIAIEPLAIWLRTGEGFEDIKQSDTTHKLSLYTDELLLYISNPSRSFPAVLRILEQFSKNSGYKLNYQKIGRTASMIPVSI